MENNLAFAHSIKAESKFSHPTIPDRKIPWMATDDAGKCAASNEITLFPPIILIVTRASHGYVNLERGYNAQ